MKKHWKNFCCKNIFLTITWFGRSPRASPWPDFFTFIFEIFLFLLRAFRFPRSRSWCVWGYRRFQTKKNQTLRLKISRLFSLSFGFKVIFVQQSCPSKGEEARNISGQLRRWTAEKFLSRTFRHHCYRLFQWRIKKTDIHSHDRPEKTFLNTSAQLAGADDCCRLWIAI